MRFARQAGAVVAIAAVMSCVTEDVAAPVDPHAAIVVYFDSAVTLMKTQAFYRRRVNWDSVRANGQIQIAGATSPTHTYPAIRQALLALGDHHSSLLPGPGVLLRSNLRIGTASVLAGTSIDSLHAQLLASKYALIHVPSFTSITNDPTILADTLQALIKALDQSDPCAWIVDLRHNRGGNMWPMLAGVGPVLNNDLHAGSFIDADSTESRWYYENGAAGIINSSGGKSAISRTSRVSYVLKKQGQSVAVLTDSTTASAGEAIAVAFRGLSRTRSFGGATYGVPTANVGFELRDGAVLYLTTSIDVDRTGKWYDTRIVADYPIFLATYPAFDDDVVVAAIGWLSVQPGCS